MPQQPPNPDEDIEAIIGSMQSAGSSLLDIKRVVELHDSLSPENRTALRNLHVGDLTKVAQAYQDTQHPIRATVRGAAKGAVTGAASMAMAPLALAYGLGSDAVSKYKGKEPEFVKSALQGIHDIPKNFKENVIEGGPAERAEYLANAGAQFATGAGQIKLFKPATGALGKGLQVAGEHPWHTRTVGAASLIGGIATGRPELVIGGIGGMVAPRLLTSAGQRMRIFAGENPAVVRLGRAGAQKLDVGSRLLELEQGFATNRRPARVLAEIEALQDDLVESRKAASSLKENERLPVVQVLQQQQKRLENLKKAATKIDTDTTTAEGIRTRREEAGYTEEKPSYTTRTTAGGDSETIHHTKPKPEGGKGVDDTPIFIGGKRVTPAQATELRKKMVVQQTTPANRPTTQGSIRLTPPPAVPPNTTPLVAGGPPRPTISAAPAESVPAPTAPPVTPAPKKLQLTGQEFLDAQNEYARLLKLGKTHEEALSLLEAQYKFIQQSELPTSPETTFPKGQRGKVAIEELLYGVKRE